MINIVATLSHSWEIQGLRETPMGDSTLAPASFLQTGSGLQLSGLSKPVGKVPLVLYASPEPAVCLMLSGSLPDLRLADRPLQRILQPVAAMPLSWSSHSARQAELALEMGLFLLHSVSLLY